MSVYTYIDTYIRGYVWASQLHTLHLLLLLPHLLRHLPRMSLTPGTLLAVLTSLFGARSSQVSLLTLSGLYASVCRELYHIRPVEVCAHLQQRHG